MDPRRAHSEPHFPAPSKHSTRGLPDRKIVTRRNLGENRVITVKRAKQSAVDACSEVVKIRRGDTDEVKHFRRQVRYFVKKVERIALTSKDEDARIHAIQTMSALTLVQYLAEHDMKTGA